jgi:hypothetical protein
VLPFSRPAVVAPSRPAIITSSGLSFHMDQQPILWGIGVLVIDAVITLGVVGAQRRWRRRRLALARRIQTGIDESLLAEDSPIDWAVYLGLSQTHGEISLNGSATGSTGSERSS